MSEEWEAFCDALKEAGAYIDADGVDTAEGHRHLTRLLAMHLSSELENVDPSRPQLGWVFNAKMGQDNPDGLYQQAPLDTARTYRIWGDVGTVCYLGLNLITWTFGRAPIELVLELNGDELPVDADGRFEIHVSPDPAPADAAPGAWHQVAPTTCRLLVRQFFADWEHERPAALHIECVDPDPLPPRLDDEELGRRLSSVASSVALMGPYWHDFLRERAAVNRFVPPKESSTALGGSDDQFYGQCVYAIGPDEALVYEVTPPECVYWNVQLGDRWYQSLDFIDRQSSLNHHQAVLDPDGVFRAVISHRDPGYANWLDTGGCEWGGITYRWNQAVADAHPTLRLVPFTELASAMPPGSPRVAPAERAEILRRRRIGALDRYRR